MSNYQQKYFTSISIYHIFIFKRLGHFQFSQENTPLRGRKKTKQMYDKPKQLNFTYNLKCKHLQKDLQIIQKRFQHFLQAL
jgi:hypothetical protein